MPSWRPCAARSPRTETCARSPRPRRDRLQNPALSTRARIATETTASGRLARVGAAPYRTSASTSAYTTCASARLSEGETISDQGQKERPDPFSPRQRDCLSGKSKMQIKGRGKTPHGPDELSRSVKSSLFSFGLTMRLLLLKALNYLETIFKKDLYMFNKTSAHGSSATPLSLGFGSSFSCLAFLYCQVIMNFETFARGFQKHHSWISVAINDPTMGRFMGSRAAIELESKGITLLSLFSLKSVAGTVRLFGPKLKNADSRSMKTGAIVELQVDNEPPKEMPQVIQEGDGWRFYDVSEDFPVEDLFGRSTATLTLRGVGFFYLPLMGFHEAWKRARTLCEPYIFSGRSQAIHEPQTNISEFDSIMVKRIQVELSGLGYDPGPADGVFGPRTEEAIRSFQSDNKLPPTGKPSAELAIVISALNTTMVTESESRERSTIVRSGTGFVVSNDRLLLTSQHVVENCEEVLVNIPPGQQIKGTFVAASKDLDLALLRVEGNPADSAHFREGRGVRPGEDIMVFGFPLSGALASSGNVTRNRHCSGRNRE